MVEIKIAKQAGACYGVERALQMADEASHAHRDCRTVGPLIHNPQVVRELAGQGVFAVEDVNQIPEGGTAIIRSHGVVPQVVARAHERGLTVVDATCPHVKKTHEAAYELASQGYQVVVVGEAGHPEVEGILARGGEDAVVVGGPGDLAHVKLGTRVGIVVQTTQAHSVLRDVVDAMLPKVKDLRVFNTICAATRMRQDSARELADDSDVMVVVGGLNSANTRRLAEVCASCCPSTHHIEDSTELQSAWFQGVSRIGITAGASTPAAQIEAVRSAIQDICGRMGD